MKLLKEIMPGDIGFYPVGKVNYVDREASRAVAFRQDDKVAFPRVGIINYQAEGLRKVKIKSWL